MAFPTTTLLDDFKRTENPLSNGGKWTKLNWASAIGRCFGAEFGWVSTTGSGTGEESPSGAYWNVAAFEEPAVCVRQYQEAGTDIWSLWACTTGEGTKNGYRMKVKFVSGSTIAMTLEKWVEGVKTELGKVEFAVTLTNHETAFGLTVAGGKVKGWYGATEAGMEVKVEAADATFTTGKVGLDDNKNAQNGATDFRAGSQVVTHTHTLTASQKQSLSAPTRPLTRTLTASLAQVASGPRHAHTLTASQSTSIVGPRDFPATTLLDDFKRAEEPLSNGAKWTILPPWAKVATIGSLRSLFGDYVWWPDVHEFKRSGAYWNVGSYRQPAIRFDLYHENELGASASIWACVDLAGENAYELRVTQPVSPENAFVVTIRKWTAGVSATLATYELTGLTEELYGFGLTVTSGKLAAWYKHHGEGGTFNEGTATFKAPTGVWEILGEVADASYSHGYVGLSGSTYNSIGVQSFAAAGQVAEEEVHEHTLTATQSSTAKLARSVTATRTASQTQSARTEGLGVHQHNLSVTQPVTASVNTSRRTLTVSQTMSARLARALKRTLTITQPTTALVHAPTLTPITGDGEARAEGTGILTSPSQPLEGFGEARALGVGFLTYAAPPSTPPTFDDLWYYGAAAFKREMSGVGVATANGDSVLAT